MSFCLKFQKNKKILSLLLILAFLFSLPLFYLAIDWGRWMYIHMMLIIVLFGLLLEKGKSWKIFEPISINQKFWITLFIIILSLTYRVEMSGYGFTTEGLFYRLFVAPWELLNKM